MKVNPFFVSLALLYAGKAAAVDAAAQAPAAPAPDMMQERAAAALSPASDDCSNGFFSRLVDAYREDAQPADPNAPAAARRGMESPFSSPPFPSAEWQLGAVDYPVGVPNENAQYPVEKALACTRAGQWMKRNRIELYGWINPSANASSSSHTNYPLSYSTRPNRGEFNQALIRLQRIPIRCRPITWIGVSTSTICMATTTTTRR